MSAHILKKLKPTQLYLSILSICLMMAIMIVLMLTSTPRPLQDVHLTGTAQQQTISNRNTEHWETQFVRSTQYWGTQTINVSTARAVNWQTSQAKIVAYARWQSTKVNSYTITVRDTTYMRNMKLLVKVSNGKLIEGEESYTIENLFKRLDWHEEVDPQNDCQVTADFDPSYGFPTHINLSCPSISDGFGVVSVEEFFLP